ncbi:MAG TPA: hypothetical protein VGI46_11575, partial [Candidatus Acidoferrum sp.]
VAARTAAAATAKAAANKDRFIETPSSSQVTPTRRVQPDWSNGGDSPGTSCAFRVRCANRAAR